MLSTLNYFLTTRPDNLTDTEIAQILDLLPDLEKWMADFKQQAVSYATETGSVIPGYQLKEYHRRSIPDKAAAIESLRSFDPELADKCLRPQELRNLAQLQKVMGQHLFQKLLTPHISVDTSYRLVHEK